MCGESCFFLSLHAHVPPHPDPVELLLTRYEREKMTRANIKIS